MKPEELLKQITNVSETIALNRIEQAKSEWCKEQRGICAERFRNSCEPTLGFELVEDYILNAPEP